MFMIFPCNPFWYIKRIERWAIGVKKKMDALSKRYPGRGTITRKDRLFVAQLS